MLSRSLKSRKWRTPREHAASGDLLHQLRPTAAAPPTPTALGVLSKALLDSVGVPGALRVLQPDVNHALLICMI